MDVLDANRLFTSLRDKYYTLRRKDYYDALTFSQRFAEAGSLKQDLQENDLYPYRREMDGFNRSNPTGIPGGHGRVNLASNDYLDFSHHPQIVKAGAACMEQLGAGSGSVPMLAGTYSIHRQLEKRLADFTGYPSAITFNSGYAANYGLLTTLLTPGDVAILDTHVHASILDGCHHTNKEFFLHNDAQSLRSALRKASRIRNKLVIVDGIYSMEGDMAPLREIISLAREHNTLVMVDESHAIGVMGPQGRGTQASLGLQDMADITTGSLGKALGGIGGYVTGPAGLISLLELACRSFIFSASLPPAVAASIEKAIDLLESGEERLSRLRDNIRYFKKGLCKLGLDTGDTVSAIIPLRAGDDDKLMQFTRALFVDGILVNPVFYPVVAKRKSLIRLSVSAALSSGQMDYALERMELHGKILDII